MVKTLNVETMLTEKQMLGTKERSAMTDYVASIVRTTGEFNEVKPNVFEQEFVDKTGNKGYTRLEITSSAKSILELTPKKKATVTDKTPIIIQ